ncbi:uncharacterized protein LOC121195737 [Toxotes jaculatrix]|uniref:uncharacterized protein LOC121195737 n=1 Tax=Toxotes jaculatrix TaxID=941984 RepID=UPI001B3AC7C8|nr:uncharacterized protein LOC121195737 [Toxotes jaculatrix]
MDWAVFVILQVILQPSLSVLFTVEVERAMYESEFGGEVVMGCKFQPKPANPDTDLKVTWITSTSGQEVYQMNNGVERMATEKYQGRVRLLKEELNQGWAKLQVSRLRINDSGTYHCLVQTGEGADYKPITLSVIAPYKVVTKHIEKTPDGEDVLLTCQSEGYPQSPVVWQDGHLKTLNSNTTAVSTPDQLFLVTSQIRVKSSHKNNYTCNFTNDGHSATFHIPDEIPVPQVKTDGLIVVLSIAVIVFIIVAVLVYQRRKGSSTPRARRHLVDDWESHVPADACPQINKVNEKEGTMSNEDCMEENLGVFLKAHYADTFSTEVKSHLGAFDVEELPNRLQNNERQAVKLQALLPEAGEILFLEGPSGSGKTTVAHVLISSWAEGPAHALSDLLNLSILRILIYVDCSNVKGDLFQEIVTQLSLTEKTSTEYKLRTVLTRSSGTLLLLDGYREGNRSFDESLKTFLRERAGCRVLVMACPGHCPTLKETVGTGAVLMLQTQTVKY